MKQLFRYASALAVALILTIAPASAQRRATTTQNDNRQTTSTTTKQSNTTQQQKSTTSVSDRSGSKSGTTTKSTTTTTRSSSNVSGDHRNTGSQPSKPSSQPGNQPSNQSGNHSSKPSGNSSKPIHIEQPSLGTHTPGKAPDKPSGKYEGHYGGRPAPGHTYQEHKPKPAPAPSKPGHYKPVPYYHHGDHYYGHFIDHAPRGLYSKRYNGIRYYYADGVFYQRVNNYYRVCRPPYGYKIAWSKFGFTPEPVWYSPYAQVIRTDVYYADGVFYRLSGRYFYVIEPPVGAIVPYLPSDYYVVEMYGGTGYQVDNTIYQAVVLDGYLYYEVTANIQPRYY